jgi:flagellar biosynthetic protein FlhB
MLKAVPKADVVITNPTHYAVALEYDRAVMAAPTVTAKGADIVAAKIREVAAEHRVPVVENRPLAQALWREVDIGDPIPEKFYEVISIVLAEVYRAAGTAARRTAEAMKPMPVEVPAQVPPVVMATEDAEATDAIAQGAAS